MANPNVQRTKGLVSKIWNKDIDNGPDEIVKLCKMYRQKYADWAEVELYHAAAGSTPLAPPAHEDFPGDDSVLIRLQQILDSL